MALRSVLRYLQVNSGDLEKGVIRFEANVSVRRAGAELGTRTEIKNLNSIRSLGRAVEFEIQRQSDVLDAGGTIHQDTLGWDEARQVTVSQRSKEEAHDYRYFPEPDLPPLHIDPAWIEQIRKGLPELPAAKRDRFVKALDLSVGSAALVVADSDRADYFEKAVGATQSSTPTSIANWLTGELFGLLNESGTDLASTQLTPEALAELVDLVETGQISRTSGKQLLAEIHQSGGSPRQMVEQKGLLQLSDAGAILPLVEEVLNSSPEQVNEYLSGKTTLLEWFVGQVMRLSRGRAEAGLVRSALETALAEKSRTPE
jgi:aspartyl-tRNA(Asn)/glutamyl-tRNA(Gln) amidotransferase subunit B